MFITKEEVELRKRELRLIVKLLDDVGWVYRKGSNAHVKRHERSEWARQALRLKGLSGIGVKLPSWLEDRVKLAAAGNAVFCLSIVDDVFERSAKRALISSRKEISESEKVRNDAEAFRDVLHEFERREKGTKFADLVRKYINERFEGVQAAAAKAAYLEPQLVGQIYNAVKCKSPHKRSTVIALAFAFELDLAEASEFLKAAGMAFSDSDEDQFFQLCFKRRFYRIDRINEVLWKMQREILGSKVRDTKHKTKRKRARKKSIAN